MSCYKCDLSRTRTNVVLGSGNKQADIMLIGEAPGYNEDKQGFPFIGDSGKYIRGLLRDNGYTEENIFITNVVKCRPPKNRTPDNTEITTCVKFFLSNEITAVNPIFIIAAGRTATQTIFGQSIIGGEITMKNYVDRYYKVGKRWILPIYHPSYILQNDSMKDYYAKSIKNIADNIDTISKLNIFDITSDFNKKLDSPF